MTPYYEHAGITIYHGDCREVLPALSVGPYLCPKCKTCLSPKELGHIMCRKCAEKDMAKRLGAGLLDLPADWYDNTPDRGPQ